MFPTSFEESNIVLNPPSDMTLDECSVLSVCLGVMDDLPVVISCWKPTMEELEEINRLGRIWLIVCGTTMPPVIISGTKPIMRDS